MFETKYYKDYRHNYLIVKGEGSDNIYLRRMVTGNTIAGLLPCREKHINGEILLYYEITSKQSLASVYENARISMKQMRKLLLQLRITWEEMSRYLLEESGLVLLPEYIYVDVETGEMLFLYYPFLREDLSSSEEKYMVSLLEFLMDRVDSEDRQAVEAVYKMYELAEKEQFVMDEILQWFEQDYEDPAEGKKEKELCRNDAKEADGQPEQEGFYAAGHENKASVSFRGKLPLAGFFAGLLGAAGLYYLYSNYMLGQRESVYFYAALAADVMVISVSLLWWCYEKWFKGDGKGAETLANRETGAHSGEAEPYQTTEVYESSGEREAVYGNTVFIPWAESRENKLYGMGKGNKNHIDLNRLPLTVGKLAGSVDLVIAEQSLSRRHVRFTKSGSDICMTDLNSTNGTFKNGFRLEPNTTEIIEPGDEIRLGKLKFIYR